MGMKKRLNITVETETYDIAKKFCNKTGMKLLKNQIWADRVKSRVPLNPKLNINLINERN